jgi:hypothetical protein
MKAIGFGFALLPGLLLLAACSRPVSVSLEGNNPPTFVFSGDGSLRSFVIYEEKPTGDGGECLCLVWFIIAYPGEPLEKIGKVRYGVVPQGFKQTYPESGPPAPIVPERTYQYQLNSGGPKVDLQREFGIYEGKLTYTLKE